VLFRRYASTIRRVYEVRYDALTQSVNVLDNNEALANVTDSVRYQLSTLHDRPTDRPSASVE